MSGRGFESRRLHFLDGALCIGLCLSNKIIKKLLKIHDIQHKIVYICIVFI